MCDNRQLNIRLGLHAAGNRRFSLGSCPFIQLRRQ